ncbi:MAG TPA: hypothetical protein IAC02_10205 [Candidatus Coprovivens excrementavium]|nr:hypothetical protein [Candidatus Coprovivens excrementavium]
MGKNNEKKKNKKINYAATTEQKEIRNLCIVVLVVVLCVGGIYLLTRAFVTKDLFSNDEEDQVVAGSINYDVAIMGQILNRPYDEYYVAIYNSEDLSYSTDMNILISEYNSKEEHLHIYTVDLANTMNIEYYDPENVDTKVKKLSDLKVGDITLLKIEDGKIDKFIVDYAKMEKELGLDEEEE